MSCKTPTNGVKQIYYVKFEQDVSLSIKENFVKAYINGHWKHPDEATRIVLFEKYNPDIYIRYYNKDLETISN